MKKQMMQVVRRLLSLVLVIAMSMSLSVAAYASESVPEETSDTLSAEDAACVALAFVSASTTEESIDAESNWTQDTVISSQRELYDEEGSVNAYSFTMSTSGVDTGYVVVSARLDMPSLILEYSDTAEPLYEEFEPEEDDHILLTGAMDYALEVDGGEVETLDGRTIDSSDIVNTLTTVEDEYYIETNQDVLESSTEAIESTMDGYISCNDESSLSTASYISDPKSYADSTAEGPFVLYLSDTHLAKYMFYGTVSDYSGYSNHCGPTAITNLIKTIGKYYSISSITSVTSSAMFLVVKNYGEYFGYYSSGAGTYWSSESEYIQKAFELYGVTVSVSDYNGTTYDRIKTQVSANRPFYITLKNHSTYNDHAVVGYGYQRYVSNTTGWYYSFVAVADGKNSSARYISISTINDTSASVMRTVTVKSY